MRKRKAAEDKERLERVRSTLTSNFMPTDVLEKLLLIWKTKDEMLDLAGSLLEESMAEDELYYTRELISLVWDRWAGWIEDIPPSALMGFAARCARDAQRCARDATRMEEVRTSLVRMLVPPAVVSELMLCWRWASPTDRFDVWETTRRSLDLMYRERGGEVPWREIFDKADAVSDLWERLKNEDDFTSGEDSDGSSFDPDDLAGLHDYLADGDFKDSYLYAGGLACV